MNEAARAEVESDCATIMERFEQLALGGGCHADAEWLHAPWHRSTRLRST
jgi:hypothetical protein